MLDEAILEKARRESGLKTYSELVNEARRDFLRRRRLAGIDEFASSAVSCIVLLPLRPEIILPIIRREHSTMTDGNNYAQLTLEELLAEKRKIKRQDITGSIFVGFLLGIMLFGLITNGFGLLYTALPILIIAAVAKHGQTIKAKLRELRAEIDARADA